MEKRALSGADLSCSGMPERAANFQKRQGKGGLKPPKTALPLEKRVLRDVIKS